MRREDREEEWREEGRDWRGERRGSDGTVQEEFSKRVVPLIGDRTWTLEGTTTTNWKGVQEVSPLLSLPLFTLPPLLPLFSSFIIHALLRPSHG